ncbi:MAG TPA: ribulose-phosphate 3-epimerase [Aliicoccus persicus]|uniref:Ribulose-phosphate 3-epimerase n=1 Tax=Aliicoccus persicus TaxID=930138 RepID=A0A921DW66_9STAP|nr:ribulose-phosphate 3-epimerase [Aliicoccus persicus]
MEVKVLPSLLSADFLNLRDDIVRMESAQVDMFHLDVMDGQFVPNISYGLPLIEAIRRGTDAPLDVHLMTEDPEQFIETLGEIGVDMVSFHIEATAHAHRLVKYIKAQGMRAGIALNPQTPIIQVKHLLADVDYVLIMTVNPGFGGQSFIESGIDKIKELSAIRSEKNLDFEIEVDGGINDETAKHCIDAGATLLVSGSYLFKARDAKEMVQLLRGQHEG